jgi:hypothetical protein
LLSGPAIDADGTLADAAASGEQSNGMTMVGDRHRYAGAFDLYRITLSFAVTSAIVTVLAMTRRR